jgi:hypothetical protein
MNDRLGRPLMVGAVAIRKKYVAYYLMPIYMNAPLQQSVSPALKKRMQGKACSNFTSVEPTQLAELAALTSRGIAEFGQLELPWTDRSNRPGHSRLSNRSA